MLPFQKFLIYNVRSRSPIKKMNKSPFPPEIEYVIRKHRLRCGKGSTIKHLEEISVLMNHLGYNNAFSIMSAIIFYRDGNRQGSVPHDVSLIEYQDELFDLCQKTTFSDTLDIKVKKVVPRDLYERRCYQLKKGPIEALDLFTKIPEKYFHTLEEFKTLIQRETLKKDSMPAQSSSVSSTRRI